MPGNDLRLDYLPLLLEQLIFGDFLEALPHVDQQRMQLIDLTLLGQLQEMSLVVSVEIDRNRLSSAVC
jgi:hypothetical protein